MLDMGRFSNLGIIKNQADYDEQKLSHFESTITEMKARSEWSKSDLVEFFHEMIPDFRHKETGKYLDSKM